MSNNAYDEAVIVLDLQHMPEGCSTWPAFWSLSKHGPWPHGGEIDFIEGEKLSLFIPDLVLTQMRLIGVNLDTQNLASLHTTPQCTMPQSRLESGYV